MTLTVGQRIEAQGTGLVGREAERAFLHSVLGEEGPLVVFIHGIGGVGQVRPRRDVHGRGAGAWRDRPPPRFRQRSSPRRAASWRPSRARPVVTSKTAADAAARLASLGDAGRPRPRSYEVLRPIDLWLQQTFVPALEDNTRVVFAGREARCRAGRSGWVACSGACRSATFRATMPRRSCGARASTATTSSGSTAWHAATRCRFASPRRRSSRARISTTRSRR